VYRLIVATILLAIVFAVVVLRRGTPARTRAIKVTSRAALHRGAFVAVVEVEGRRLLVGAGAQQVTLLTELEPAPPAPPADADGFDGPLAPAVGPGGATPGDAGPLGGVGSTLLERVRRATTRVPRGDR